MFISKNSLEFRSTQLLRTKGSHLFIKYLFSFCHQHTKTLNLALSHKLNSTIDNILIMSSQCIMQLLFALIGGKRIGFIQVGQNLNGILFTTKVSEDPIKRLLDIQGLNLDLIAIELHQTRLHTEGTCLIQTSTTRRGTQLTYISDIHLAHGVQIQVIQQVERTSHQHTDSCR